MATPPSDEELLEAAKRGDEAAFEALIARCQPRIYRFGMRMCGDEEDARDVLQETLLTLARSFREIRGSSRLSTWLFAVARSFCTKLRTRGRPPAALATDASGPDDAASLADHGRGPEDILLARQLEASLRRALQALTPEHREVIVLRDGEGLTAPEVATVLGVSSEAVKSRLHRARVALKENLAPLLGVERPPPRPEACPDILATYSQHLEDEISADMCRTMEAHLAHCRHCTTTCDALKQSLAACGAPSKDAVPVRIQDAVRRAIREAQQSIADS